MRKIVLTLATCVLALCGFGVSGVAYADVPARPCLPVVGSLIPCSPGGHDHGDGGHYRDHFQGNTVILDGGPQYNVCDYPNYPTFLSRNDSYRGRFGSMFGPNPTVRFLQLRSSCGNNTVVTNDGQCVTYQQDAVRYGREYNDSVRGYNGLLGGILGGHHGNGGLLTGLEIDNLRRAHGQDAQRYGDWNRTVTQLRTVCNAQPPVTVINETPAPAACGCAPYALAPAPAPCASCSSGGPNSGSVYRYPVGAPATGDGSTATRYIG